MIRNGVAIVALLGLFESALTYQGYDPKSDANLKKTVTLSVKYEPLSDALKAISKQLNVNVRPSTAIADRKITIFVKDVPGGLVMDKIASVLECQWKMSGGEPLLTTSSDEETQRERFIAAEDLLLRKPAEQEVAQIIQLATKPPPDQNSGDGNEGGDQTQDPQPPPQFNNRLRPMGSFMRSTITNDVGELLSQASSSDMDSFWSGEVAHLELAPNQGGGGDQPAQSTPMQRLGRHRPPRANETPTWIYARYDLFGSHQLQMGSSVAPVIPQRYFVPTNISPVGDLATSKYGKAVLSWPSMDAVKDGDAFSQPAKFMTTSVPTTGFSAPPPGEFGAEPDPADRKTQSEQLEVFFKATGIPVVSDGFRIPPEKGGTPIHGGTGLEWLKNYSDTDGAFVRIEDGVAMVREGGYWRLLQAETPESLIRPMEAKAKDLTLTDFVSFFGQLSPSQIAPYRGSNPPVVRFQFEPILRAIPALKFLYSLDALPNLGQPVALASLGGTAQEAFNQAVDDAVFYSAAWQGQSQLASRARTYAFEVANANISEPEGLMVGVSVTLALPNGQAIEYQIPVRTE